MVAEISRGSQNFWDAPLAPTLANFGPKCCFLVRYSPILTCVPNLKLLASTVAEIIRRSQNFWDAPLAQPLPILILKLFWQATARTQVV